MLLLGGHGVRGCGQILNFNTRANVMSEMSQCDQKTGYESKLDQYTHAYTRNISRKFNEMSNA